MASVFVLVKLRIDDPLDAFAVHGACGVWGLVACALFSTDRYMSAVFGLPVGGLVYGSSNMLVTAIIFVVCISVWVGFHCLLLFKLLHKLGVLRVGTPQSAQVDLTVANMMIESGRGSFVQMPPPVGTPVQGRAIA